MNITRLPDVSEEQSRKDTAILSAVAQINETNQFRTLNLSNYNSLMRLLCNSMDIQIYFQC